MKVLVKEKIAESGVDLLREHFEVDLGLDMDNDALARDGHYAAQSLAAVRADLRARRAALLDRLAGLDAARWQRPGHHPQQGAATVLDVAINAGLHDIDHLEQIARCRADVRR